MKGFYKKREVVTVYDTTALSFLKKGYQILPLSKKTGLPVIKYKNIKITEDIIKSINWMNCDYALLMRGVWGIDIDTHKMDEKLAYELRMMIKTLGIDLLSVLKTDNNDYGLDGYSSIVRHENSDELIRNFKNSYTELTDSGGLHILFKKRDGIDYTQKIGVMDGVDIKAHDNNYIKIFPSTGREVLKAVKELPFYEGEFEKKVFSNKQQIVTEYFGSSVVYSNKGHEGEEAYQRVSTGMSVNRNDDLFKAACWAFENNHSIEDLMSIIGTVKGRDVFTREEFERTIESARRRVNFVTFGT